MKVVTVFGLVLGLGVFGFGCGSDSSGAGNDGAAQSGGSGGGAGGGGSGGAGGSGGTDDDGGADTSAGGGDTGGAPNDSCAEGTNDKSGIPGQVNLFPGTATSLQYRQSCITIKAGQSIQFSGDFTMHPLRGLAGAGANPIPALTSTGSSLDVTFPNAGAFRYDCKNHPTDMFGTVHVKP